MSKTKPMKTKHAPVKLPDTAATLKPARRKPFFVVTIRCCDGARERLKIYYDQRGLHPGATAAAKKIAAVLTHYRPAQP